MSATEKVVEEIVSTFRDFLYRDLFYVVGGISVIAAFFFSLGKVDTLLKADAAVTFFVIVIGYVVGYATQEAMSIAGLKGPALCRL